MLLGIYRYHMSVTTRETYVGRRVESLRIPKSLTFLAGGAREHFLSATGKFFRAPHMKTSTLYAPG